MPTGTETGLRRLSGARRVFAVAGSPLAVVATYGWALALMRSGFDQSLVHLGHHYST